MWGKKERTTTPEHTGDGTSNEYSNAHRRMSPATFVPTRRDSSIAATSTNPRVRSGSLVGIAARNPRLHTPVDFRAPESKESMKKLSNVFLPVVLKVLLRRRRQRGCAGGIYPPRTYTAESVVSAITSSQSLLAEWPPEMLSLLAQEATFQYLRPPDIIVYHKESHLSTGIVVLLHGQLSEARKPSLRVNNSGSNEVKSSGVPADRPISSQRTRTRSAPDVMCLMPVLCEDRSLTCLSCQPANESADVAVIPSRWLWQVFHTYILESSRADGVLESFRRRVLPLRREMMLSTYYATSVVLQRSWVWPFLGSSDRVKLARAMGVKVLSMGDVLHHEGQYDRNVYVLRRGTLTVVVKGEPLTIVEPGTAFGEESLLFNDPCSSSVVAGSVSELYCLPVGEFKRRLDKYPHLLKAIVPKALERRTQWLDAGRVRDIFGLVSLLGGVPCLSHTTDAMREDIARDARIVTVPPGQLLVAKDTLCDTLFVIGRGSVRVGGALDPAKPHAALPDVGESRSAGDFFGELCLRRHFWPVSVVSETSVDLWMLSEAEMHSTLQTTKAHVQAEEVCKQGIQLYRAQNGDDSIREEFDEPSPPSGANSRRSSSVRRRRSQTTPRSTSLRASHASGSQLLVAPLQGPDLIKDMTGFDWLGYCQECLAEGGRRAQEDNKNKSDEDREALPQPREIQPTDKEVEKTLSRKVVEHISLPADNEPNAADADFPGEVSELQAIIVEQLLLTPSEEQPKFLRQIGKSNVKLVAAEEDDPPMGGAFTSGAMNNMNYESMGDLNDVSAELNGRGPFFNDGSVVHLEALPTLAPDGTFDGDGDDNEASGGRSSHSQPFASTADDAVSLEGSATAVAASTGQRNRRGTVGPDDSLFGLSQLIPATSQQPRASVTRTHLVRPSSSGVPISPRNGSVVSPSALADLISPRSAGRPPSVSEPRQSMAGTSHAAAAAAAAFASSTGGGGGPGPGSARGRPASVDYGQQNKISADRSASVLDRYVKIEDQGYFNAFVKVLPLQQDELWIPDDDAGGSGFIPDALILTLMHVQGCDYLAGGVMDSCAHPVLKVSTGSKVLRRVPFPTDKGDCRKPRWDIDVSSFITFVRRGVDITFAVCDTDGNGTDVPVYEATLSTSDINENGGVGQRVISLHETDNAPPSEATARPHKARVTVTMMAVTASKYKVLHNHLRANHTEDDAGHSAEDDSNACYLQIIGVEGLKHRVEASVTVIREADGAITKLLETPRIVPKTRTPCWPGTFGFTTIRGDGYVTFQISHKDSVIGACETTADELVFTGPGLRRFPLLLSNSSSEVIGDLVARVVATSTPARQASKGSESVIFLYAEQYTMAANAATAAALVPDPYIVVRGSAGECLLRTPMAIGTESPTWAVDEAACFLPCPPLAGSEAAYRLEVHDNGEGNHVLGHATVSISRDGLGPQNRYDVPLDGKKGTVRLTAMRLPVQSIWDTAPPPPSTETSGAALVLVHVAACHRLHRAGDAAPDSSSAECSGVAAAEEEDGVGAGVWSGRVTHASRANHTHHLDAIVTMRLVSPSHLSAGGGAPRVAAVGGDAQRDSARRMSGQHRRVDGEGDGMCLNTGVATTKNSCNPRWLLHDTRSSALFRVGPGELARLASGEEEDDVVALFEVFDGLINKVDRVGVVRVPVTRLLGTGTHRLTLRAVPCRDPSDGPDGTDQTDSEDDEDAYFSGEAVGVLELDTICGQLNAQVRPIGTLLEDACYDDAPPRRTQRSATVARAVVYQAPQVRLRLSSATNLVQSSGAKRDDAEAVPITVSAVTVSAAQKVLLNWTIGATATRVPMTTTVGDGAVVFADSGSGGLDEVVADLASLAPTSAAVRLRLTVIAGPLLEGEQPSASQSFVLHGEVPFRELAGIAPNEVHLFTVLLSDDSAAAGAATVTGPDKKPLPPELTHPTVTISLVGTGASAQNGVQLHLCP